MEPYLGTPKASGTVAFPWTPEKPRRTLLQGWTSFEGRYIMVVQGDE